MMRSKKGMMDDAMFWIFRIILVMLIVLSLVFFINSIIKRNIDTGKLELNLIAARVINSPDCLARLDDIGGIERVMSGVVDSTKYNEQYLGLNCVIQNTNSSVGVRITISGMEPLYINKEYYDDIEPLTFSQKYQKVTKRYPIQLAKDGVLESKTIEIIAVEKKR